MLEGCAPALSAELRAIPYGRGAAVTLAYDRRAIAHPLDAYGFVVPTVENTSVIACTFLHQKWEGRAPAGKALLRAFATNSDAELDKAALVRSVHDELSQWLEISAEPEHAWVSRYLPSTPHYNVGHAERVQSILNAAKELPGFYLTGNAYKGVGIPDSIALAEQTAQRIATT